MASGTPAHYSLSARDAAAFGALQSPRHGGLDRTLADVTDAFIAARGKIMGGRPGPRRSRTWGAADYADAAAGGEDEVGSSSGGEQAVCARLPLWHAT